MRQTLLILRTRLKIANNHLANLRNHLMVHLIVFVGVVMLLIFGGTAFFHMLFSYVNRLEDFGAILMDRLVGMVMMTFFSMLIFSNLIITLSTTYISREVEYYMAQPVEHRTVFFVKLAESILYSSWAFAILSLPFFASFGIVRGTPIWFYGGVALLIVPFLIVPAALGALITMALSAIMPARRTLKWSVALVALAATAGVAIVRLTGAGSPLFNSNVHSFTELLNLLRAGSTLWSPHTWTTEGILRLSRGDVRGFFYWLAMLWSTALLLLQVCVWLAPLLYYRGWCLAGDSASARNGRQTIGQRVFRFIDRRLGFLSNATRALVVKDLKTFWRDPTQWSQLIILFGVLIIYTTNLRSPYFRKNPEIFFGDIWPSILSFFNMSAACFILSILTTRFVYPMLSLEGKQFWAVGLAPLRRTHIVWEKYALCWLTCLTLTEALVFFSNWVLEVPMPMRWLSSITVLLISFGLTSLAVGLGAATPNFKEDNPARIANGMGGTLNVILSMVYIGLVVALEIAPIYLHVTGALATRTMSVAVIAACAAALLALEVVTVLVPMRIGLARWREIEF